MIAPAVKAITLAAALVGRLWRNEHEIGSTKLLLFRKRGITNKDVWRVSNLYKGTLGHFPLREMQFNLSRSPHCYETFEILLYVRKLYYACMLLRT